MSNYNLLEEKYSNYGLTDNRLRDLTDLLLIYNVNFFRVPGFLELSDLHQITFAKFILNFYNSQGLEARENIIPTGIHYVEDKTFFCIDPEDDMVMQWGRDIISIANNKGAEKLLHSYKVPEYAHLPVTHNHSKRYLRFEFEDMGNSDWLHIINENEWF